MEARCVAKYIRIAPRKMRLVANIVRGKSVNEAIGLLKFTTKSGARPTLKAIQSAVANIVNREDAHDVNPDTLVVKVIFVDEGPTYKRFLPRAMGRATPIRKRMSHLTVAVAAPAEIAESDQPAAPADDQPKKKRTSAPKSSPRKTAVKKPASVNAKRSAKKTE
jgi:large subunit ribosomal protein L22